MDIYLLIKQKKSFYKVGKMVIYPNRGEVYYVSSETIILQTNCNISSNIIRKYSFHSSGRTHITTSKNDVIEFGLGEPDSKPEDRQEIKNIGYQSMLEEIILEVKELPLHIKPTDEKDIILDIRDHNGSIKIIFSLISGKNIIASYEGRKSGIKKTVDTENIILDSTLRGFSNKKGFSDKAMQFIVGKFTGDNKSLKTNRRTIIPRCQKVPSSTDKLKKK